MEEMLKLDLEVFPPKLIFWIELFFYTEVLTTEE